MNQITNKDQLRIIEEFLADLGSSLGVKQKKVSFESLWDDSPPPEADGESLNSCRTTPDYRKYEGRGKDKELTSFMYTIILS